MFWLLQAIRVQSFAVHLYPIDWGLTLNVSDFDQTAYSWNIEAESAAADLSE